MNDLKQRSIESQSTPPALGLLGTTVLFGGAALLLFVATHLITPALATSTGIEPVLLWFISGGLVVFAPLLAIAFFMLQAENAIERPNVWRERLRFRLMTSLDWSWSIAAIASIGVLGAVALMILRMALGRVHLEPSFMSMAPLTAGRYWILLVWIPFWVLNILGEELLWRGVILPRQESAFGRWAWVANGSGWLFFHLAFGMTILAMLLPMVFVLPYIVQRRRNSWVGVVIHAGINGPGFLAVAFGFA